MEKGY